MTVVKSVTVALVALTGSAHFAAAQVGVSVRNDTTSKVEILFVQSAKGATLANGKLSLTGIAPTTVFFSDRPHRIAGHVATREMVPLWSEGKDSFLKDPPNATLSSFTSAGDVVNAVVVLRNPTFTGTTMTYDVMVTQGTVPPNVDGASLFIDIIGMPLTPLSYAGAARRAYRRTVIY
jgi:hypothetical protein